MRSLPLAVLAATLSLPALSAKPGGLMPRRFEPGLVSTGFDDAHVSFSPDGQTLYLFFISNRPVEGEAPRPDTEIWTMDWAGSGWGAPRHVAELSSPG